jgi:hypothetical protein
LPPLAIDHTHRLAREINKIWLFHIPSSASGNAKSCWTGEKLRRSSAVQLVRHKKIETVRESNHSGHGILQIKNRPRKEPALL